MKNFVTLFFIVTNTICFSCLAQYNERNKVDLRAKNSKLITDRILQKELSIVSYHVVEKINMKFGSTTTTYTVPNVNLINTNDLGENNTRTVTPKYTRAKVTEVIIELPYTFVFSANVNPTVKNITIQKDKKSYVRVNILRTYERVLEQGYLSIEMLKKVGDWRYFEGDLDLAARWYTELLCMTTDLEVMFYYRYAQSLKFIGQNDKANEMMAIYESKK